MKSASRRRAGSVKSRLTPVDSSQRARHPSRRRGDGQARGFPGRALPASEGEIAELPLEAHKVAPAKEPEAEVAQQGLSESRAQKQASRSVHRVYHGCHPGLLAMSPQSCAVTIETHQGHYFFRRASRHRGLRVRADSTARAFRLSRRRAANNPTSRPALGIEHLDQQPLPQVVARPRHGEPETVRRAPDTTPGAYRRSHVPAAGDRRRLPKKPPLHARLTQPVAAGCGQAPPSLPPAVHPPGHDRARCPVAGLRLVAAHRLHDPQARRGATGAAAKRHGVVPRASPSARRSAASLGAGGNES